MIEWYKFGVELDTDDFHQPICEKQEPKREENQLEKGALKGVYDRSNIW